MFWVRDDSKMLTLHIYCTMYHVATQTLFYGTYKTMSYHHDDPGLAASLAFHLGLAEPGPVPLPHLEEFFAIFVGQGGLARGRNRLSGSHRHALPRGARDGLRGVGGRPVGHNGDSSWLTAVVLPVVDVVRHHDVDHGGFAAGRGRQAPTTAVAWKGASVGGHV